jgi:hypothetical protein
MNALKKENIDSSKNCSVRLRRGTDTLECVNFSQIKLYF